MNIYFDAWLRIYINFGVIIEFNTAMKTILVC
jgi:hypothetical protein